MALVRGLAHADTKRDRDIIAGGALGDLMDFYENPWDYPGEYLDSLNADPRKTAQRLARLGRRLPKVV